MIDSVLKGTGNSRFLKSAVPAGTSWADALAMLQAGTFPIDFNGINTAGFQQVGTPLNKANLLKDATAAQIGLPPSTTPDGMFQALGNTGELHVWRKTVTTAQEIPAGYTLGDALENINPIKLTDKNYNTAWFAVVSSVKVDDNGNVHFTDADSDYTRYMRWNSSEHAFEGYDVVSGNGPGSIRRDAIPGNFIKFWAKSSSWLSSLIDMGSFYFVPSDATVTTGSTPVFSRLQRVVGYAKVPAGTTTTYPVSTNPNAYQEGDDAKEAGYVVGATQKNVQILSGGDNWYTTLYYADSVVVDDEGKLSLQSPNSYTFATSSQYQSVSTYAIGRFIKIVPEADSGFSFVDGIWFVPSDSTIAVENFKLYASKIQSVTGYAAIPAGTTIEYLGKLGDKARVQVMSYVGTGTYGADNPCSLTFDFAPIFILIAGSDSFAMCIGNSAVTCYRMLYSNFPQNITTRSNRGRTISFYQTTPDYGARAQCNSSGVTYNVIAIG